MISVLCLNVNKSVENEKWKCKQKGARNLIKSWRSLVVLHKKMHDHIIHDVQSHWWKVQSACCAWLLWSASLKLIKFFFWSSCIYLVPCFTVAYEKMIFIGFIYCCFVICLCVDVKLEKNILTQQWFYSEPDCAAKGSNWILMCVLHTDSSFIMFFKGSEYNIQLFNCEPRYDSDRSSQQQQQSESLKPTSKSSAWTWIDKGSQLELEMEKLFHKATQAIEWDLRSAVADRSRCCCVRNLTKRQQKPKQLGS